VSVAALAARLEDSPWHPKSGHFEVDELMVCDEWVRFLPGRLRVQ
jgi:hypothetical protein